jgi:hypothetical protein
VRYSSHSRVITCMTGPLTPTHWPYYLNTVRRQYSSGHHRRLPSRLPGALCVGVPVHAPYCSGDRALSSIRSMLRRLRGHCPPASLLTGVEARRHRRFSHDGVSLTAEPLGALLSTRYECTAFVNNGNLKPSSSLNSGFAHWQFLRDHGETFPRAPHRCTSRRSKAVGAIRTYQSASRFWQARARRYHDETFPRRNGSASGWCVGMERLTSRSDRRSAGVPCLRRPT